MYVCMCATRASPPNAQQAWQAFVLTTGLTFAVIELCALLWMFGREVGSGKNRERHKQRNARSGPQGTRKLVRLIMETDKDSLSKRLVNRAWIADYVTGLLGGMGDGDLLKSEQDDMSSEKANETVTVSQKLFLNRLLDIEDDRDLLSVMRKTSDNPRAKHLSWRIWHLKNRKRMSKDSLRLKLKKRSDLHINAQKDDGNSSPKKVLDACIRWRTKLKKRKSNADIDYEENFSAEKQDAKREIEKSSDNAFFSALKQDSDAAAVSDLQIKPSSSLYIVLCSLHGLVRGQELELGKDSDTGGQVKYAIEHAKALAKQPNVVRVDLLTRMVCAPNVDADYGVEEEALSSNAFITRLSCGDKTKYIAKESLWPHIREFADRGIVYIRKRLEQLRTDIQRSQIPIPESGSESNSTTFQGYPSSDIQVVLHAHYADAMDALGMMAKTLNYPLAITGHSLGRNKKNHLLKSDTYTFAEIEEKYKISRRIEAEERGLDIAEVLITSTRQEIEEQWELYDGFNEKTQEVFFRRGRQMGWQRFIPKPVVIPPGIEFPELATEDLESKTNGLKSPRQTDPPIWNDIKQFLTVPAKPAILLLCRPDTKKNIIRVIDAYGKSQALKDVANLVLILGNRDDIQKCTSGPREILSQVLLSIDKYDLYGKVAYPKRHKQQDISGIYGYSAQTGGVFINSALQEPFGLTLIEAAGYGVPVVATKNGGPVDIIATLENGILVDPLSEEEIEAALFKIVTNRDLWVKYSTNGLNKIHSFSWNSHCVRYLEALRNNIPALYGRHSLMRRPPSGLITQHSLDDKDRAELEQQLSKIPRTTTNDDKSSAAKIRAVLKKSKSQKKNDKLVVVALPPNDGDLDSFMEQLSTMLPAYKSDDNSTTTFMLTSTAPYSEIEDLVSKYRSIAGCKFSLISSFYGSDLMPLDKNNLSLMELCQSYELQKSWRWAPIPVIKKVIEADLAHRISGFEENWEIFHTDACICASVKDSNKVPKIKTFKLAPQLRRALRERGLRTNVFSVNNKNQVAVVPVRCSLGMAVRHAANVLNVNLLENVHILAPGDLSSAQDQIDSPYQELLTGAVQVHYV